MFDLVSSIDELAECLLILGICTYPILLLLKRRKKKRYEKRYREAKRFDDYATSPEKLLADYALSISDQVDSPPEDPGADGQSHYYANGIGR